MMKSFSIILTAVCLSIVFTSCKKEDKTKEGTFTILSYNVAGLPDFFSGSNPEVYSSIIGELINEYDIVHLQEDFCYHDSIRLRNTHQYVTETTGCIPGGSGLNTFSNFPILDLDRISWDDCADFDCLTPKGFTYTKIEVATGVFIDFYNMHANAQSYEEALAARRKNIIQMCAYINEKSAGNAVIIAGDFNSRYTRAGDTIKTLLDMGFKDVWIELVRNGNVPEKGSSALTSCDPDRSAAICEKVDKVFYKSSGKIVLIALQYQLDDERYYYEGNDTLPLSDHWPLLAKFQYKAKQ